MPRRVLQFINLSIAVLLVLGLAAAYWYAWRPLPKVSGQISAPVVKPATVGRDALGTPHVEAADWQDAVVLQGYVTAQDRMWQMDEMRRLAAGDLSEVAGQEAVANDQEAIRLRLPEIAAQEYRSMTPADRELFAAYARGVNAYLETHQGRVSVEFAMLRYDPRPWTITDSLLVGLQMFRTLSNSWRTDLRKAAMLTGGDAAKVNYLFSIRAGPSLHPGSNAWVVSGAHTASGRPILANDPHLEYTSPSLWYLIQLKAPGLDVAGSSIPGLPGVVIGHNGRIAWGATNLQFDVQDLYIEKFDPRTGRYLYRGQIEQARLERDVLAIRGRQPLTIVTWVTRHGPIIASENNQLYSLRWTAAEPGTFQYPFFDIDRAGNWSDFTAALARYPGPAQNFLYADVNGNTGYHAAGLMPIRKNFSGDVPLDGSSGDNEWSGFIPFDQLPSSFNPPSGILVSANEDPFPENYPYVVNGLFDGPDRAQQIQSLLSAHAKLQPRDMLVIQKDVYSAFAHFLAGQLVAAFQAGKPPNAALAEAIGTLRNWNGQMEIGQAAPMVVLLTFDRLRQAIADRASPGKGNLYTLHIAPSLIESLLRARPKDWFPDYNQLLLRCLAEAVEDGKNSQGSSVQRWDYGHFNQLAIVQPVVSHLYWIGTYFNIGPVPMSGSPTTVKQRTNSIGPSMRMVVDFSDFDHSLQNITLGESGHVLSSHFKDQWDAYYVGRSFPMQFNKVDAKDVLRVAPEK